MLTCKNACVTGFALAAFALHAASAQAEGYVLGAGSWSCSEIVEIMETSDPSLVGQVAGWVFGFWSSASFAREPGFTDIIEEVGGETILRKSVEECRKAPPDTPFYSLVNSMIANTK